VQNCLPDATSEQCSCLRRATSRERQKNRTPSDWIHHREEGTHDLENTLGSLNHRAEHGATFLVRECIARPRPSCNLADIVMPRARVRVFGFRFAGNRPIATR